MNPSAFFSAWISWLGHGNKPVTTEEAQRRANICLQCPKNQPEGMQERIKKIGVVPFQAILELKHGMHFTLPEEERLRVCQMCGCLLTLKVWEPEETIKDTEMSETKDFPEFCWVRKLLE